MGIVSRRALSSSALREVKISALGGGPFLLKKCDALGCEASATEHCSSHGVHFCRRHYEAHREEWHVCSWERTPVVARC